jgi:hypothetical protein
MYYAIIQTILRFRSQVQNKGLKEMTPCTSLSGRAAYEENPVSFSAEPLSATVRNFILWLKNKKKVTL